MTFRRPPRYVVIDDKSNAPKHRDAASLDRAWAIRDALGGANNVYERVDMRRVGVDGAWRWRLREADRPRGRGRPPVVYGPTELIGPVKVAAEDAAAFKSRCEREGISQQEGARRALKAWSTAQ